MVLGKTLSLVLYTLQNLLKYPDVILITNIDIKYPLDNIQYKYNSVKEMLDILILSLKNDNAKGYIIVCDEIQLVIEKMAQMGNKDLLAILSQLRKLHVEILGTCQLFNKLNKDIRDYLIQNGQIINCTTILGSLTIQRFFDMDSIREMGTGQLSGISTKKFKFFIHTQELYASYETSALIGQILELLEGSYAT